MKPRVYLIEVKVKSTSTCLSLWASYYFVIESMHAFFFVVVVVVVVVNNVTIYTALLVYERCSRLGYEYFL